MTNRLNGKKESKGVLAALVAAFVFALSALVTGLALEITKRSAQQPQARESYEMPHSLLAEAADGLVSSASAIRLASEPDAARRVISDALISAVRAETALECECDDWCDCRDKESFLNDAVTLLGGDAAKVFDSAELLYGYAVDFKTSVESGAEFNYNGELAGGGDADDGGEPDGEVVEEAEKLVSDALGATVVDRLGSYNGIVQLSIERDGVSGYATVHDGKVCEFDFERGGGETDVGEAERVAGEIAGKCGYGELEVYGSSRDGDAITVRLCRSIGGALCRDECATARVEGGVVTAFSAGRCGKDHELPEASYTEEQARASAPDGGEGGVLVTTFDGKRDRICYEYRYELDDGVHYVYVCAQNGKQMDIR